MKQKSLSVKQRRTYSAHARRVRGELIRIARKQPKTPPPTGSRRGVSRAEVQEKTASNCHMCGDDLPKKWQIGHVKAYRRGGVSTVQNCLPICPECNRLRWSYRPEVLRMILQLGRYAKQAIRGKGGKPTPLGEELIELHVRSKWSNRRRHQRAH
jgi:5-methylcytosine-specific restriction endonuclease McrA